jgi:hypothetical protein
LEKREKGKVVATEVAPITGAGITYVGPAVTMLRFLHYQY